MDPGGSSLISLRSISDGDGEGESERKRVRRPSSGKKPKKPASPYGTLRTSPKKPAPRRTGREVWVQAVQQGGGVSAESKGANTWRYGKPQHLVNATSATPFLKEQLRNGPGSPLPNRQPRPGSAGARVGGSGPVYKDAESYYDDIQVLKRQLKEAKTENELVKANNGRLQDEVVAKSRKIEELLNPDLQSNDLRRTLTSKKPDTSEVVMSLRRKVYKAEENLRDKENVIRKMKSDMKRTNAEELILENQVCMYEMERLRRMVDDSRMHATRAEISDADAKGKPQLLLKRLQDDNYSLVLENKSLKNDLMKLHSANQTELDTTKDYEDMNRNELLQKISSLEQRLKIEEKKSFKDDGNTSTTTPPPDAETIDERCIELKGPLPQQIKQLRARERELVGQVDNMEETVRKLKEDRTHYRKMNDEYRQQIDTLTQKLEERSVVGRSSTPVVEKKDDGGGSDTASVKSDRSVKHRKTSLKKDGSSEKVSSKPKEQERKVSESKVTELREKNAAKKIQKEWRQNQETKKEKKRVEEEELEDAIIQIQSSWRGHKTRQSYLNSAREEEYSSQAPAMEDEEEEDEEDLILIQSALRGHQSRKQLIQQSDDRVRNQTNNQVNTPTPANPHQAQEVVEESDDDDDDVVIGSSASLTRFRQQQQQQQQPSNSQPPSQSSPQSPLRSGGRNANRDRTGNERARFEQVIDDDSEGSLRSLRSLKSSSTPWSSNVARTYVEEDSEDGEFSSSNNNNNNNRDKRMTRSKGSSEEPETSDITKKWADSGEKKEMRSFQKRLSLRRSQQLTDDFKIKDRIGDDEEIAVPSFQRKMTALAASRKTDVLDDELF